MKKLRLVSCFMLCAGTFCMLAVSVALSLDASLINHGAEAFARAVYDGEDIYALPADAGYPGVYAGGAILIEASTGNIIYEKNAYRRMPMASTTKIMTVITALESGYDLNKTITVTKAMTGAEGSSIYLYEGERFTLRELLYAVMLNSANDAAVAVAIAVGGSVEGFAGMMNALAAELKLENTCFRNPHGLDADGHYTTAYDLAQIMRYAMKNDTFREITSAKKMTIPAGGGDSTRYLTNHNRLLSMYEWCNGGKTGYTKKSGRCLVSSAERDGVSLICVTLDDGDDWNDHMEMFNYGFAQYRNLQLCVEGEYSYSVDITGAEGVSSVRCVNASAENATVPKHIGADELEISVELPPFLYAPVNTGDYIGRIVFRIGGKVVGYSPVVAMNDAPLPANPPWWEGLFKKS